MILIPPGVRVDAVVRNLEPAERDEQHRQIARAILIRMAVRYVPLLRRRYNDRRRATALLRTLYTR